MDKIAVKEIMGTVKAEELNHSEYDSFEWRGVTVTVAHTVPFATALTIIEAVAQSCFDEEGEYYPILANMMFRHEVIAKYTNIEVPEDVEECYALFYNTGLWDEVIERISDEQLVDIQVAAHKKISYTIELKAEALKKEVTAMAENLSRISDAFKGIAPEDISGVFGAFANGGIDESKIVNAILAQNKEAAK